MSPRSATPTLPLLDTGQVARLRRRLDEGADIFEALDGGAAAWQAGRARGAGLHRLDLVLEHMERSSRVSRCPERTDAETAGAGRKTRVTIPRPVVVAGPCWPSRGCGQRQRATCLVTAVSYVRALTEGVSRAAPTG